MKLRIIQSNSYFLYKVLRELAILSFKEFGLNTKNLNITISLTNDEDINVTMNVFEEKKHHYTIRMNMSKIIKKDFFIQGFVHELRHIYQYETEILKTIDDGIFWNNEKIMNKSDFVSIVGYRRKTGLVHPSQYNFPWEKDALNWQTKVKYKFNFGLIRIIFNRCIKKIYKNTP